jgi:hypothetical protein
MSRRIPLADQANAVEVAIILSEEHMREEAREALYAARASLQLIARYEKEVRDLLFVCIKRDEELPGSEIRVLTVTPSTHGVSAIAQGRDEGGK